MWFPPGRWTGCFTGRTCTAPAGGATHDVTTSLDTMPVFVRAGGIVVARTDDVPHDTQGPGHRPPRPADRRPFARHPGRGDRRLPVAAGVSAGLPARAQAARAGSAPFPSPPSRAAPSCRVAGRPGRLAGVPGRLAPVSARRSSPCACPVP
ncbi:hypothetical protein [Streptomyces sp. NPDC007264]|uniref:hypothetical protein n=1 Tax=Streptomyces sp. NPDC007264 TaxID=3364777 RepID=UPI0036DAB2E2